jgi:acetyl esterase/lipase
VSQLGPAGIAEVGGEKWWQWRKDDKPLKAEWIEMREDFHARAGGKPSKVLLFVHGGAFYFGSVDEHRYFIQRNARKLKARAFAPRYRLAPQYPFPCGLHDCLTSYLYLLQDYDPKTILVMGDSAGGGLISSLLITLRDQGLPLPAGAMLLSPWVDLTHSFPSVCGDGLLDYIPTQGFIHRPSLAWPPAKIEEELRADGGARPSWIPPHVPAHLAVPVVQLNGKEIEIRDQIQLYASNFQLAHPLVSSALNPSLGGLCPLLIQVGSAELLADEQIYYAHKAANPAAYPPSDEVLDRYDPDRTILNKYPPTEVQLQVWDDLCHVPHTLAWTTPARYMYRSVAQFGAWAVAKAQHTEIESGDDASETSSSSSRSSTPEQSTASELRRDLEMEKSKLSKRSLTDGLKSHRTDSHLFTDDAVQTVGTAGDPLPRFKDHMIRQRININGQISPLEDASTISSLRVIPNEIGIVKEAPVHRWRERQITWDAKHTRARARMNLKRAELEGFGLMPGMEGEHPPPTALVRRWKGERGTKGAADKDKDQHKAAIGLRWWQSWQSKHDSQAISK